MDKEIQTKPKQNQKMLANESLLAFMTIVRDENETYFTVLQKE